MLTLNDNDIMMPVIVCVYARASLRPTARSVASIPVHTMPVQACVPIIDNLEVFTW